MLKLTDLLERHNGCCTRPKSPLLTEGVNKQLLSENLQYHIDNKLPLVENTFRYGSRAFIDLWNEARLLHESGIIKLDGDDKQIVICLKSLFVSLSFLKDILTSELLLRVY